MDLVFLNIRIGLFHNDHTITTANIAKAKQMLEEGGDWDRRNRLKVEIETMQSRLDCFQTICNYLNMFSVYLNPLRCTRACTPCPWGTSSCVRSSSSTPSPLSQGLRRVNQSKMLVLTFFFHSYELMDYVKFVEYTVWISVLALDRWRNISSCFRFALVFPLCQLLWCFLYVSSSCDTFLSTGPTCTRMLSRAARSWKFSTRRRRWLL